MENEIMLNEEVFEATEEIATTGAGKGLKIAAGVGIAALVGTVLYKFVAKPIAAKIKAKKEQNANNQDIAYFAGDADAETNED